MRDADNFSVPVTDLHCHILPQIDDGAENEHISIQMLEMEYQSGIRQIAMTPHFDCERISLEEFLKRRTDSKVRLKAAMKSMRLEDIRIKVGAEVYYSPNLVNLKADAQKLCLEGTPFMLLELPTDRIPPYFDETIYSLQSMGIKVLMAHVERYPFVMDNPPILCEWLDKEIYAHINAGTLLKNDKRARLCRKLIDWNLIYAVASDAHSTQRRHPNLMDGLNRLGTDTRRKLVSNADAIFNGYMPEMSLMYCPKKKFGRWH